MRNVAPLIVANHFLETELEKLRAAVSPGYARGKLTAMEALLLVAEHDGPTMLARIGVMRALHRHKPEAAPTPRRKRAKAYQIIE